MQSRLLFLLLAAPVAAVSAEIDQEFTGPGTDSVVSIDEIFPRARTFPS